MSKYSEKVARRRQAAQLTPEPAPAPEPKPDLPKPCLDMQQPPREHPYLPPVFIPVSSRVAQLQYTLYNTYAKSLRQREGYLKKKSEHYQHLDIIPELIQEVAEFEAEVRAVRPHWQHRAIPPAPPRAEYCVPGLEKPLPPIDFGAIGKLSQIKQMRTMEEAISKLYHQRKRLELEERKVQTQCIATTMYVDQLKKRIKFAQRVLRKEGATQ